MRNFDVLEWAIGRRLRSVMRRLSRLRSVERRLPRPPTRAARQPKPSGTARHHAPVEWWSDDPHWFPGGTPPRRHNRVTPLVDGDAYFTALYEALTEAQHYVYVAGWCLTPAIALLREDRDAISRSRLLDVLHAVAAKIPVRILLWSGDAALFQPTRRQVQEVRKTLMALGGDIQCRLDTSAPRTHCHHQKAVVVDGRTAFVGGIDLTTVAGDRWDTPQHALRVGPTWHDVQVRIEGEAVADVEANFRQRWTALTSNGELPHRDPDVDPAWQTPVQIVRTIPKGCYDVVAEGEFGIHHAYLHALREAQHLIYLENQYLWSDEIVEALIAAMTRRAEQMRIVILLPARADRGKYDNDRQVDCLRKEDHGRGIVSIYTPFAWGPSLGMHPFAYRPTYSHAKVGIVDDEWFTVGSANLNERGLARDSEINAVVHDPAVARALRVELWAEHLALPCEQVAEADPFDLTDRVWPDRARTNVRLIKASDQPLVCPAFYYARGHVPGAWFLEEAEAFTFDR